MKFSIQRMKKFRYAYSLFKYNQPKREIPTSIYNMGGPSVKLPLISWLFIIAYKVGYVHISNSGWTNLYVKIVLITWYSSSWFIIYMAVYV